MSSGVSKADADHSLSLVRQALGGAGAASATSGNAAGSSRASPVSDSSASASADTKTGWNGQFIAPDGVLPTLQVAVCRSFLDNEKNPRLWPAWKRGVKEGDVVECTGAPGRTGTGQSTFFCWDVTIIGEARGRLEV